MEPKTKVMAEPGRQDLTISREFALPVGKLFRAYTEAEIVEKWMGTKVLKLENRPHGSYQFQTTNQEGAVVFQANGTIHDMVPDQKIVRTFEMEGTPFGVQLEFLEFEAMGADTSKLNMHVVYRTAAQRDQVLQMPFAQGINWAHNRLEEVMAQ